MMRTGTGMCAGSGTEAGVLEDTTPIAQNNNETDCYKLPPRDQTTAESTVRPRASGVHGPATARAQRSSGTSRETLPAQVLTSAGTRSAGRTDTFPTYNSDGDIFSYRYESSTETQPAWDMTNTGNWHTGRTDTFPTYNSDGDIFSYRYESSTETQPAWDMTNTGNWHTGLGKADEEARFEAVMELLKHIAKTDIRDTLKHSLLAVAVASPFIIAGTCVFGPFGSFIGGALGGAIAGAVSKDYKTVPQILMELPPAEKEKLCAEVMAVVRTLDWTDAAQLIALVTSNSDLTEKVLGVLKTYLTHKLKA